MAISVRNIKIVYLIRRSTGSKLQINQADAIAILNAAYPDYNMWVPDSYNDWLSFLNCYFKSWELQAFRQLH